MPLRENTPITANDRCSRPREQPSPQSHREEEAEEEMVVEGEGVEEEGTEIVKREARH